MLSGVGGVSCKTGGPKSGVGRGLSDEGQHYRAPADCPFVWGRQREWAMCWFMLQSRQ